MKKIFCGVIILFITCMCLTGCSFFGDKKEIYNMNETFTYKDVNFKISNFRESKSFTTTTGSTETTDNYFIFFDIYLENNGKESYDVRTSTFSIVVKETEQVISYYPGYTYLFPNNVVRAELQPTFSGTYSIVFEVSKSITECEYQVRVGENIYVNLSK